MHQNAANSVTLEEGEIEPTSVAVQADNDPSFEWASEDEETTFNNRILRFVVGAPSSLIGSGRIALVDGHSEIQFGRDASPFGSQTPRIRIKSMEVSKHHATAYWDSVRCGWAVVDMGSVHGTFLRNATTSSASGKGRRLSAARSASIPRPLSHLDTLNIGPVEFDVHIHEGVPCSQCSPSSIKEEIQLFSKKSTKPTHSLPAAHPYTRDPRKAISALKRDLLALHPLSSDSQGSSYIDRSARRRALYPPSMSDAPGTTPPSFSAVVAPPSPSVQEPTSHPPVPLSASNVGHQLLMKQGWTPGSSLGISEQGGRLEPLDGQAMSGGNRRGLGLHKRKNI